MHTRMPVAARSVMIFITTDELLFPPQRNMYPSRRCPQAVYCFVCVNVQLGIKHVKHFRKTIPLTVASFSQVDYHACQMLI